MNKKTVLVTGASRGIGAAIAKQLALDGYHVLIHYATNRNKACEVLEQISALGGSGELLQTDLQNLVQTTELAKRLPPVEALVLNASVQIRKPWQEISAEEAALQLNCNYTSSLLLMQAVIDHMKAQHWGRIVTIGSVQEAKPHPDMLVYSASKAAQTNMVKSLALQLAKDGITVNSICPGVICTDRNKEVLADEAYARKVTDSIPVGFCGQPEDCAGIVSLLCSESGRYITGQSIYVDGGKSIQ